MGAELFHENRHMDRQMEGHDKANSHFSQFCELA
jgi:hypothetical protein